MKLDFIHFTYKPGQCSCYYGPLDQAMKHWRKDFLEALGVHNHKEYNAINHNRSIFDYAKYIIFKNADNGSGIEYE